ncbi:MAG: CD225/dispanin family protein [Tannerella sp.]|jgi:hypothetical protein|nr:CD225/dispanin family protein [Tannerella sp.]
MTSDFSTPTDSVSNGGLVMPKNYLTEAIIVTVVTFLCCCNPISLVLGIIAIVKANAVTTDFARGDMNSAINNASTAKTLVIWAAVLAVVIYIILIIVSVALGAFGAYMDAIQQAIESNA